MMSLTISGFSSGLSSLMDGTSIGLLSGSTSGANSIGLRTSLSLSCAIWKSSIGKSSWFAGLTTGRKALSSGG